MREQRVCKGGAESEDVGVGAWRSAGAQGLAGASKAGRDFFRSGRVARPRSGTGSSRRQPCPHLFECPDRSSARGEARTTQFLGEPK